MSRILCVENDPDSCEMIRTLLSLAGKEYIVDGVYSASEAMRRIGDAPYDLYVLDLWLPEMDGADLCRWIRGTGTTCPIIFYSGGVMEKEKQRAFAAGADEYLEKPNDLSRLVPVVEDLLRVSERCNSTAGTA